MLIALVIATIAFAVIMDMILAFPFMWAWNYIIPFVSSGHIPELGYWRAFAALVLLSFIKTDISIDNKKS